ncbi:protein spitz-like [Limulus polyphemus]|uniref:Protein spitz-like n=1 Tax=Limulus polyphemus TaxID=6850 RepID=A0ABM1TMV6_LIMPO|nr:protein spitz-like [Limulus polyphemus]
MVISSRNSLLICALRLLVKPRTLWVAAAVTLNGVRYGTDEACSSRSTPKPRAPLTTTTRPNITFQTYACPEAYAKWYCLNGATCFSVKIGESILYNCECADGYMGQRCEFKDLDGSYAIKERESPLTTASIAGGLVLVIMTVIIVGCMLLSRRRQRRKNLEKHVLRPFVIPVLLPPSLPHTISEVVELRSPCYVRPQNTLSPMSPKFYRVSRNIGVP